jgi:hypothetical protein
MTRRTGRAGTQREQAERSGEAGLGSIEVLPIGLLVMTVMTFIVMGGWNVVDAKMAAISAARSAARTTVETASRAAGTRSGVEAWEASGRRDEITIDIDGEVSRCGRIVATAAASVAPIPVGMLRSWKTIVVRSRHSEVVDPYRGTLDGEALC